MPGNFRQIAERVRQQIKAYREKKKFSDATVGISARRKQQVEAIENALPKGDAQNPDALLEVLINLRDSKHGQWKSVDIRKGFKSELLRLIEETIKAISHLKFKLIIDSFKSNDEQPGELNRFAKDTHDHAELKALAVAIEKSQFGVINETLENLRIASDKRFATLQAFSDRDKKLPQLPKKEALMKRERAINEFLKLLMGASKREVKENQTSVITFSSLKGIEPEDFELIIYYLEQAVRENLGYPLVGNGFMRELDRWVHQSKIESKLSKKNLEEYLEEYKAARDRLFDQNQRFREAILLLSNCIEKEDIHIITSVRRLKERNFRLPYESSHHEFNLSDVLQRYLVDNRRAPLTERQLDRVYLLMNVEGSGVSDVSKVAFTAILKDRCQAKFARQLSSIVALPNFSSILRAVKEVPEIQSILASAAIGEAAKLLKEAATWRNRVVEKAFVSAVEAYLGEKFSNLVLSDKVQAVYDALKALDVSGESKEILLSKIKTKLVGWAERQAQPDVEASVDTLRTLDKFYNLVTGDDYGPLTNMAFVDPYEIIYKKVLKQKLDAKDYDGVGEVIGDKPTPLVVIYVGSVLKDYLASQSWKTLELDALGSFFNVVRKWGSTLEARNSVYAHYFAQLIIAGNSKVKLEAIFEDVKDSLGIKKCLPLMLEELGGSLTPEAFKALHAGLLLAYNKGFWDLSDASVGTYFGTFDYSRFSDEELNAVYAEVTQNTNKIEEIFRGKYQAECQKRIKGYLESKQYGKIDPLLNSRAPEAQAAFVAALNEYLDANPELTLQEVSEIEKRIPSQNKPQFIDRVKLIKAKAIYKVLMGVFDSSPSKLDTGTVDLMEFVDKSGNLKDVLLRKYLLLLPQDDYQEKFRNAHQKFVKAQKKRFKQYYNENREKTPNVCEMVGPLFPPLLAGLYKLELGPVVKAETQRGVPQLMGLLDEEIREAYEQFERIAPEFVAETLERFLERQFAIDVHTLNLIAYGLNSDSKADLRKIFGIHIAKDPLFKAVYKEFLLHALSDDVPANWSQRCEQHAAMCDKFSKLQDRVYQYCVGDTREQDLKDVLKNVCSKDGAAKVHAEQLLRYVDAYDRVYSLEKALKDQHEQNAWDFKSIMTSLEMFLKDWKNGNLAKEFWETKCKALIETFMLVLGQLERNEIPEEYIGDLVNLLSVFEAHLGSFNMKLGNTKYHYLNSVTQTPFSEALFIGSRRYGDLDNLSQKDYVVHKRKIIKRFHTIFRFGTKKEKEVLANEIAALEFKYQDKLEKPIEPKRMIPSYEESQVYFYLDLLSAVKAIREQSGPPLGVVVVGLPAKSSSSNSSAGVSAKGDSMDGIYSKLKKLLGKANSDNAVWKFLRESVLLVNDNLDAFFEHMPSEIKTSLKTFVSNRVLAIENNIKGKESWNGIKFHADAPWIIIRLQKYLSIDKNWKEISDNAVNRIEDLRVEASLPRKPSRVRELVNMASVFQKEKTPACESEYLEKLQLLTGIACWDPGFVPPTAGIAEETVGNLRKFKNDKTSEENRTVIMHSILCFCQVYANELPGESEDAYSISIAANAYQSDFFEQVNFVFTRMKNQTDEHYLSFYSDLVALAKVSTLAREIVLEKKVREIGQFVEASDRATPEVWRKTMGDFVQLIKQIAPNESNINRVFLNEISIGQLLSKINLFIGRYLKVERIHLDEKLNELTKLIGSLKTFVVFDAVFMVQVGRHVRGLNQLIKSEEREDYQTYLMDVLNALEKACERSAISADSENSGAGLSTNSNSLFGGSISVKVPAFFPEYT